MLEQGFQVGDRVVQVAGTTTLGLQPHEIMLLVRDATWPLTIVMERRKGSQSGAEDGKGDAEGVGNETEFDHDDAFDSPEVRLNTTTSHS